MTVGEAHRVITTTRGHDGTGVGTAGDGEPSGSTGQAQAGFRETHQRLLERFGNIICLSS